VVLTSPNGARVFLHRLQILGRPVQDLASRVAAIGPATAQVLREAGVRVDAVPDERFQAEGLLEAMRPRVRSGERILLVRAAEARAVLPEGLRTLGAAVDVVAAYRASPGDLDSATLRRALAAGEIDAVTFTSGSTVRHFIAQVGAEPLRSPTRPRIVCLGSVTAEVARAAGIPVDRVAAAATMEGLVDAVVEALTEREGVR